MYNVLRNGYVRSSVNLGGEWIATHGLWQLLSHAAHWEGDGLRTKLRQMGCNETSCWASYSAYLMFVIWNHHYLFFSKCWYKRLSEKSILLLFLVTKMVKTPIYAIQPPFHDIASCFFLFFFFTKITPNKTKDNLSPEVQRGSSVYINIFCSTTVYYFLFRLHFCPGFASPWSWGWISDKRLSIKFRLDHWAPLNQIGGRSDKATLVVVHWHQFKCSSSNCVRVIC